MTNGSEKAKRAILGEGHPVKGGGRRWDSKVDFIKQNAQAIVKECEKAPRVGYMDFAYITEKIEAMRRELRYLSPERKSESSL